MFELIALAYQANLTRVASFMMAREVSMRTYNNLGVSDAFHPLSHHQNNPAKIEKLVKVQNFHTKVFTGFLDKLAATPDGDGSLLDHSIILFGSNMSNSDLHNNDPLPSAVFGRAYGKIKGGQHLHYPQNTPHANLLLTLLDRAGVAGREGRRQHRHVRGSLMRMRNALLAGAAGVRRLPAPRSSRRRASCSRRCKAQDPETALYALSQGVDANSREPDGTTPLHYAAHYARCARWSRRC